VITGMGLIFALGWDQEAVAQAIRSGQGGVRRIQSFPIGDALNHAGAEVPGWDEKVAKRLCLQRISRAFSKSLKYMARDIELAVVAAQMALADAGLADGGVDPTRLGVDLGAGLISSELDEMAPAIERSYQTGEFDYQAWGREGIPLIQPIWLLRYLPNMLACHISILLDCQGPSNTITEAEAACNVAIGEAARIIARGRADVMICGGADSKIHPLSLVRMALMNQLSRWTGDPDRACRPFDRDGTGWVPGEGAGILILEDREHALKRGARIHGEVLGSGSGCDGHERGGIDPENPGTEIAMRAALRNAGLSPADLGHVNAHGSGHPDWDRAEARAIGRVVGPHSVPVTALKGYLGNCASGCGGVETIISLLLAQRGEIPAIKNCDDPRPEVASVLDLVRGSPRPTANPVFLNTNLTRHGQAAALVIRAGAA
jgi:3-oxoacyl-[acyl-carrier-protein] synthase II